MRQSAARTGLLAFALLVTCAASDFGEDDASGVSHFQPTGAFGAYLTGRFAMQQADYGLAADKLAMAARDFGLREVTSQAFLAAVMAGRPDAERLAAGLPDNAVAQLVLADADARAGRWDDAEARYAGLPQQGITQVLRPLLVAWAQQGAGRTQAALGTLQPLVDGGRLRGVMSLHAGLIADLGGQKADAERLYRQARVEYGALNLRLGVVLASWQARQGFVNEAQETVHALAGAGELAMARPALEADAASLAVRNATDGIAEAYLAMGATLRQQNAGDMAQIVLRLALSMRPDFTAARLILADILDAGRHGEAALAILAPVPESDPLTAVVRLRQAAIEDGLRKPDEAARTLEELAKQYPDRPEPLALAGDILRRKNEFAAAVVMYDRATERLGAPNVSNWPLFYERGVAHERAGQWPLAEADFKYALQLAPDQASILNYLGYAWADQGRNLDEARKMIERAVELRPNEGSFVDSLGWVMLRQGDAPGALRQLERAVELEPEDGSINGHLGDALAAAGRWREAGYEWRRALTLKVEPEDVTRINAKLATLPAEAR